MKNNFLISYKVKMAYRVNTVIYSLKQFPLIGKIIPDGLYGNDGLKVLGYIISFGYELFSMLAGKIIYIFLMLYLPLTMMNSINVGSILNVFLCLSIIGGILNNYIFDVSNDKYYLMIIMKMNVKKYTLSNYIFYLIKLIFGFLIVNSVFFILLNMNIIYAFLITIFIYTVKINITAYLLNLYKKDLNIELSNKFRIIKWLVISLLFIFAYILPLLNISLPIILYLLVVLISFVLSIYSLRYIFKYDNYYQIYHKILKQNDMNDLKNSQLEDDKNAALNIISNNNYNSNKKGYAYFNDLFMKRHSKVLYKFAKNTTYVIIGVILLTLFIVLINSDLRKIINQQIIYILPILLFLMYFLNTGQRVAKIMFMNCDAAMLTFSFYRRREVILSLFKERLKSIVGMNLIPSLILSFGLDLILYVSGGSTYIFNYVLIFLAVNAMSVFFSVHNLVIYYLLQPYNSSSDIKGSAYRFVSVITYYVCFYVNQLHISVYSFGIVMTLFSITYVVISLILVYKFAYKTFKIRA